MAWVDTAGAVQLRLAPRVRRSIGEDKVRLIAQPGTIYDAQAAGVESATMLEELGAARERILNSFLEDHIRTVRARLRSRQRARSRNPAVTTAVGGGDRQSAETLWQRMDVDGDGTVTMDEIQMLGKALGAKMKKQQLKKMFSTIDKDGSGDIDFDEFSQWWDECQKSGGGAGGVIGDLGAKLKQEAEEQLAAAAAERVGISMQKGVGSLGKTTLEDIHKAEDKALEQALAELRAASASAQAADRDANTTTSDASNEEAEADILAEAAQLMLLVDSCGAEINSLDRDTEMNRARERTRLRGEVAKLEADTEVEAQRLHDIGFHFSELADGAVRVAEEAESSYAKWCADVEGAEREKMWEKAGGKTRFAEMKVKREEAKSRARTKREIATAAEAKRDKEKAVAAQAREVAVTAKQEAEAVRQRVNKEEADEAVARANALRAKAAMREYVQEGTLLLRRKLSSSVQITSLREGEVRRLRASFAETLVRIEHGVGRWNERWEERYASERPPWEGRPEADRVAWNAEELVRQKSEAQMLDDLDNALATAKEFLAAEEVHFKKTRDSFGNRHSSTDQAHSRVMDAKAKVKAAEELSSKSHTQVDQARIERHEAFEGIQRRMDAVWTMDGVSMERALFKAVVEEDAQMIGRLLEAGVDTGCLNTGGQTPLELAATRGKLRSLFLLLDEDGSGEISKSELRQLGRAVGVELSDKDIKPLMAVLDNDESGSIDLDEFSDDYSRSFLANFLAQISPTGFGWVEEEIQRLQRLDAMLQKKLDADKAERDAMTVFASKAAGVIATKAAKAAAKKAAEDAAAAAEAIAREELRNVLLQCVNEGATNIDGMNTVLAKFESDDRRETDTAALLERWKARLEMHRQKQELADARERERQAKRRAKADREAAEVLCNLDPHVFAERLEMVMRRVAHLDPSVLEPEASAVLRQAAGHAGDSITELTRRRVRQDTEAAGLEVAVVLRTTPPGTTVDERQSAFRHALAQSLTALDGIDVMRIAVTGMGPAGTSAPADSKCNSKAPPPATPGWLRVSFRVLEPYGREADDGAASSETVLHCLDEVAVEGGGLEEAMESIGGLVRYEPDKHAAARAQSREMKALSLLGADNSKAERAEAEARAEEEKRAACQPIPLPFRRVTYAMASTRAESSTESTVEFDHSTVWLWYYIQGSEKWTEKDREGVRRVVFKYRRLRFGGGQEGIDDEPELELEQESPQPKSEAESVAAKNRAKQKRKQRKDALSDPVKAAFKEYDVDGSGTLDVDEVTALLHDRGFRMSSAELEGVFEAIDDDGNGVLDLSELRKMWAFLGMHMEARGSTREHVTSEEEDTVSAASAMVISAQVDTTGWCALSGPSVKCENGWWRSCDWPLAPGFEHSVWIDGHMVGTFHDPALVVTAPPNEEDAEEEDDEPTVMVTKVGSKTVATAVGNSRFADDDAGTVSTDSCWRRRKKKGPRQYSFDPVAGLLADQQCHSNASSGSGNAVRIHELHDIMPNGHLTVSIDRCMGLKREKIHRTDGVFCIVVANNSGMARRSGTVYETGRTLSWKGHHGTIVFSGLDVAPPLLHIFVLRRTPVASVAAGVADSYGASRWSTTHKSTQAVRAALVEIYTTHNPAKLQSLDALLSEWKGHEGELLANVTAKYTAQDSADFDAWGRACGCVLLGAVSLQFDQAPTGRSWRLSQDVVLLRPLQRSRGSHSEATSLDDDDASLEFESEGPAGICVSRMMLGARGGPGGWGSECVHAGKLRTKVRWEEPSSGYNTHRQSSAGSE